MGTGESRPGLVKYTVTVLPAAKRDLRKIEDRQARARIEGAILLLGANPRPPGCIRLTGRPGWRVTIGDHRIIYTINDRELIVAVVKIGHRRDVYKH